MASSSQIEIKPRADGFGAEISGVDLGQPIEPEVLGVLRSAFTEHRVLSVPRQRLDPAEGV